MCRYTALREARGSAVAGWWACRQPIVAVVARLRWRDLSVAPDWKAPMSVERPVGSRGIVGTDVRSALRMLARRPFLFLAVIGTLAIGIAGNTVMLSLVKGVLLNPHALGYDDIGRLVLVYHENRQGAHSLNSYQEYATWRAGARSITAAGAFLQNVPLELSGAEPLRVIANVVTPSFFRVLGTHAAVGQLFDDPDGSGLGVPGRVVVSFGLWEHRFGADPGLIGRVLSLNGSPYTVTGVLPAAFHHLTATVRSGFDADLYLPLAGAPDVADRSILADPRVHAFGVIARLAPGSSPGIARADLLALQRAAQGLPPEPAWTIQVGSVYEIVTETLRTPLELLLGATVVVALMVCANVSSLLLSVGLSRRRELAMRAALGASRSRLFRQILTETLVLAGCGGVAGLLLSSWTFGAVRSLGGSALLSLSSVSIDGTAYVSLVGLSILVGLLGGLLPAIYTSRVDLRTALTDEARGTTGGRPAQNLRRALVIGELAAAFMLSFGALLLVDSYRLLHGSSPGFRTDHLLTAHLTMAGNGYDAPTRAILRARLLTDAGAQPGVTATLLWSPQGPGSAWSRTAVVPTERIGDTSETSIVSRYHLVSADALTLVGIPIVKGRDINAHDTATSRPVAIVSEALAARLGGQDPLAMDLQVFGSTRPVAIVGIARNVQQRDRLGPYAQDFNDIYASIEQWPGNRDVTIVVRTSVPPLTLAPVIREVVRQSAPRLPVFDVQTVDDVMDQQEQEVRVTGALTVVFALLAAALAMLGVHSLVADGVTRRRTEIGIRMALGAEAGEIVSGILRSGLAMCVASIAVGWPLAVLGLRAARAALFGVTESDPRAPIAVSAVLIALVLVASYMPARRATRIDPATALRG
jgi:putative ABC transport system permease protein